jgi:hypothetical protein
MGRQFTTVDILLTTCRLSPEVGIPRRSKSASFFCGCPPRRRKATQPFGGTQSRLATPLRWN